MDGRGGVAEGLKRGRRHLHCPEMVWRDNAVWRATSIEQGGTIGMDAGQPATNRA